MHKFLSDLWQGRLQLWEACIYAWLPTYFAEYFIEHEWGALIGTGALDGMLTTVFVAINVYVSIGVWRCAPNVEPRFWTWVARVAVVILNLPLLALLLLPLLGVGFYSLHTYENYVIHHDMDRVEQESRPVLQPAPVVPAAPPGIPAGGGKDNFDLTISSTQHLQEEMRRQIEAYKNVLSPTTPDAQ